MLGHILCAGSLLFGFRAAAFNLYPTINPDKLAKSFGISADCLDALNSTVACDQDLFQMANTVDSYLWETGDVTNLCTAACTSSAQNWWADVANRCSGDSLTAFGKLIPAESIAGRYVDGLDIACLQSSKPSWCLIESQDWVGSDVIRPDCSVNAADPSCSDATDVTADNERMVNLYSHDLLCSDCFLKMFHQRMSSPYLPNSNYSEYLVSQYQDVVDVCGATMPDLTIRMTPYYENAPVPITASAIDSTTCIGQTIKTADLASLQVSDNTAPCDLISTKFNVATGDLQSAIGDTFCTPVTPSFCVPAGCSLMKVPPAATCDSIVASISTGGTTITTLQFLTWNPHINGLCDGLLAGDYVCIAAPGGSYVPPPVSNKATDNNQQRGGSTGGSDSEIVTGSVPSPIQPGITDKCNKYALVKPGDFCQKFAQANNVTPDNLYAWNPVLGAGGAKCDTQFWTNYYYCVGTGDAPAPPSTPTGGAPAAPSPTQGGITGECNKYAQAKAGDSCQKFAQTNNVTPANLYAWNPVLGAGGAKCETQFWTDYYYCVGTGPPIVQKQDGITGKCNKFALARAGDSCQKFAQANNVTPDNFYSWNPVLGAGGSKCNTQFWTNYSYCVGVSG